MLCALGAVLLALGTLAGIANRQLVDGDRFADHVDHIRQDDAVARQIGLAMTDAIIEADANLVVLRPLIETTSTAVVQSPTFSPLLRPAVAQVHDAFTQPGSGEIVLRLADIGAVMTGVISKFAPQSAADLPPDLEVTLARIGDQSAARATIDTARQVALLSWALPLAALGCLAGAVVLFGVRRNWSRPIGLAVVAAGGFVVLVAGIGAVAAGSIDTDSLSGALSAAMLRELQGELWWPAAVLLGTGTVLRVLGSLRPHSGPESVLDWRDWVAARPRSQRTWALRAVLLVAAGAVAVVRPLEVVSTLTAAVGLGVLVVGLAEGTRVLLQAAENAHDSREKREPHESSGRRRLWTTWALAGLPVLVVTALVLSLAWPTSGSVAGAEGDPAGSAAGSRTPTCNGFSELCDRAYNDVAYPSSHNSMSAADQPGWYLAEQPTGLIGQLDAGIRALLIDSWYGQATTTGHVTNAAKDKAKGLAQAKADFGPGAVESALRLRNAVSGNPTGPVESYLCHGVCDIGATKWEPVMADVRDWMKAHPREVVTFFIEDSVSAADTAALFEKAGLLPYVATHQVGRPWPTLGQMVDSGKRLVVLMQEDGGGTKSPWLMQGWDQAQDTNYDAKTPADFSCKRNRGTEASQLLLINNWLNNFDSIVTDAKQVNGYDNLYPRMVRCQRERGMIPNYVAVNYFDQGDLFKVVNELNGMG